MSQDKKKQEFDKQLEKMFGTLKTNIDTLIQEFQDDVYKAVKEDEIPSNGHIKGIQLDMFEAKDE